MSSCLLVFRHCATVLLLLCACSFEGEARAQGALGISQEQQWGLPSLPTLPTPTSYLEATDVYNQIFNALKAGADSFCLDPDVRDALIYQANLAIQQLYVQGTGYNKSKSWYKSHSQTALEALIARIKKKPPCAPPGYQWLLDFDTPGEAIALVPTSQEHVLDWSRSTTAYVGTGISKRWVNDHWQTVTQTSLGANDMPVNPLTSFWTDPVLWNGFAGYDRAARWFGRYAGIVGVEADFGLGGKNSGTQPRIPGSFGAGGIATAGAAQNDTINVSQTWQTSVRARFGVFVTPSILAYATVGAEFLHMSASINCTLAGACGAVGVPVSASASTTEPGVVFGGGFDFLTGTNWRGRVEYLHNKAASWTPTLGNPATFATSPKINVSSDTVTVGLIYAFGGPIGR